ncbi:hypothetical protein M427DRAFT_54613 [Gonapodya prolifera JEL478]|uniref:RNA polymerase II-associated protein 3 n=1 Tax=Gonapodya prolifera (strain JEL478) TaxID=1344416 RepID=A0A139AKM1_GONPJ|nr:hypothetical protein M427DRAFT_54613 [Gonapodya prolifera JEL478]|eukprot:KXS17317.1 hypothetical protein M427DRAFT_54613 [Gonapodya prolifera JEL478]
MSSSTQLQFQIRQNAQEIQDYVADLRVWEKEIKEKDKNAKDTTRKKALPPVRGVNVDISPPSSRSTSRAPSPTPAPESKETPTAISNGTSHSEPTKLEPQRHQRIKSSDYRAWDTFDVDKMVEVVDADAETSKSSSDKPKKADQANAKKPIPMVADLGFEPSMSEKKRLEKALMEKEIGNELFKKSLFAQSIPHYSTAMSLDPKDPVYPLNRAAAFLKLRQWSDAEKDCNVVLKLDAKNVKGLWRRGIARRELGHLTRAKEDLELAAVLEPTNKSVKEELKNVLAAIKAPQSASASKKVERPLRRRLKIVEVGEPVPDTEFAPPQPVAFADVRKTVIERVSPPSTPSNQPALRPSSANTSPSPPQTSRPVSDRVVERTPMLAVATPSPPRATARATPVPEQKSSPTPRIMEVPADEPLASKPASRSSSPPRPKTSSPPRKPLISEVVSVLQGRTAPSLEASTAKEISSPATLPNTGLPSSSTLPRLAESSAPSKDDAPLTPRVKIPPPPTTLLEFERGWRSTKGDVVATYIYLKSIPISAYPSLLKSGLESHHLTRILSSLQDFYLARDPLEETLNTLKGLRSVPRFAMGVMFLGKDEKTTLDHIFKHLLSTSERDGSGIARNDVLDLAKAYQIKI